MPLVLYHMGGSPPSRVALLTIRNLDLDVEIRKVDLFAGETKTEAYLKMNPQHTVPTLDDDGFYLWESRAIATYLAESRAPNSTLYPKDPKEQAIVNQRLYFDMGTLGPKMGHIIVIKCIQFNYFILPIFLLCQSPIFQGPVIRGNAKTISEEAIKELHSSLALLEGFLEKTDYVAGNNLTLADLSILAGVSSLVVKHY